MDIEIIRNQSDDFSFRIVFGNDNFHELCKILHCSPFGYLSHPFSCFEFYRHEYICCSIPDIFVIIFFWTSRFHWNGFPLISKKLFWFLVKAYERFFRVISFFFSSSVSSTSVHFFLPSGGVVHACAMISAVCFSVYFMGCPVRVVTSGALWIPSSKYLFLILPTVFLPTFNISTISVFFLFLLASNRIRALVSSRALFCPFLTKSMRYCTSSSSSFIFAMNEDTDGIQSL